MTFNQSLLNFLTQNNISPADFAAEMGIKHVQNVKHLTNPRLNTLQTIQSALSALTGKSVFLDLNEAQFVLKQSAFVFTRTGDRTKHGILAINEEEARKKLTGIPYEWNLEMIIANSK